MKFTIPRLALNAQKADYVPRSQRCWAKPRPVGRQSRCKIVTIKHNSDQTIEFPEKTRIYFGGAEDAIDFRESLVMQRATLNSKIKACPYAALYEDIIDDTTADPRFDLWNRILWGAFYALDVANRPEQYSFHYHMRPYRQHHKSARTLTFQAVSSIGEPIVTL